jgi:Fuc2NAc and GlcNAc transferase
MFESLFLLSTLTGSLLLTGLARELALKISLLDLPNQRSSHSIPTPRGGGLGIVGAFLAGLLYLLSADVIEIDRYTVSLLAGSLLVAGIGFWDDLRPLPAHYRFAVHLLAAALLVRAGLAQGYSAGAAGLALLPQFLAGLLLVLAVVWSLNLFNFMDGVDGLAGMEGGFLAGAGTLLLFMQSGGAEGMILLALAGACLGFLIWNWPPARIFMGDVGSGFLGFVLAGLALQTSVFSGALPIYCWLILPAVFVADATITLLRRLLRGEQWYAAHRSHAYQQAALRYRGHLPVTLGVTAINILWLLPLAALCVIFPDSGGWLTLIAYLPLVALAWRFDAGGKTGT